MRIIGVLTMIALGPVRSVLGELETLERKLTVAEEHLLSVESQRAELHRQIAEVESLLASTRLRQRDSYAELKKRIRALERMPAGSRAVLLGGSRSFADYLEMSRLLRWVAIHDKRLHQAYAERSDQLEEFEAQLQRHSSRTSELVVQARSDRNTIAETRQSRLDLFRQIASQKNLRQLTASEKRAARKRLGNVVRQLQPRGIQSSSFWRNHGRLPWPATGAVDVKFGRQEQRASGTVTSHNGIDIRAAAGAPVQAVAAGKVVYADWFKGYGQLVIVDHGEHYHSLVAHLSRISVEIGNEVAQGAILGIVGDTGSMRGTVLYFEIRVNGAPTDPIPWLRQ